MGKAQKDKGARGENELCRLLRDEFGLEDVRRNLGQARDSGNDIHAGPIHFEVKRRAKLKTLEAWMAQAAASKSDLHAVAARADGGKWMVVMPWSVFAFLARESDLFREFKAPDA